LLNIYGWLLEGEWKLQCNLTNENPGNANWSRNSGSCGNKVLTETGELHRNCLSSSGGCDLDLVDSLHLPTYVLSPVGGGRGVATALHCRLVKWVTLTAAQMTIAGQQILGNCCSCWPGLNAYALTE